MFSHQTLVAEGQNIKRPLNNNEVWFPMTLFPLLPSPLLLLSVPSPPFAM